MNTKDIIYTEDFLRMDSEKEVQDKLYSAFQNSIDREYGVGDMIRKVGNTAKNIGKRYLTAGRGLAEAENKITDAETKSKVDLKSEQVDNALYKKKGSSEEDIKKAVIENKTKSYKDALRADLREKAAKKKIGGAALGGVAGGAAGVGLAHVMTGKLRKEINELESKSELTENEKLRLAALKKKLKTTKIASGIAGAVAGAAGGYHLGKKSAYKDTKSAARKFMGVKAKVNKAYESTK